MQKINIVVFNEKQFGKIWLNLHVRYNTIFWFLFSMTHFFWLVWKIIDSPKSYIVGHFS